MSVTWKYGRQAREEDIQGVGEALSVDLPQDFVSVVRSNDGGRPSLVAVSLPSGREVVFERLLSVTGATGDSIRQAAEVVRAKGAERLIPFGRDPFGNLFCFSYHGQTPTGVVFWDHETDSTTAICGGFSELLGLLHEPR